MPLHLTDIISQNGHETQVKRPLNNLTRLSSTRLGSARLGSARPGLALIRCGEVFVSHRLPCDGGITSSAHEQWMDALVHVQWEFPDRGRIMKITHRLFTRKNAVLLVLLFSLHWAEGNASSHLPRGTFPQTQPHPNARTRTHKSERATGRHDAGHRSGNAFLETK